MEGFYIRGKFTVEALSEAIRSAFPDQLISVFQHESEATNDHMLGDIVIYSDSHDRILPALTAQLEEKEAELKEMEGAAMKAMGSIKALHVQQKEMFQQFELLRQRYDEQKNAAADILWNHCVKHNPELRQIPAVEDASFIETPKQVGRYIVGNFLGEGQFASVSSCWLESNPKKEYALKMINKDKIANFVALTRVSNEIANLGLLRSPFIVSVLQVMHTSDMLYLVTEKGGSDLFEFFKEHPAGVSEAWAREIMANIMKGVLVCHENEICHRDLKPENILLTFDTATGRCVDLKLCDFGLSTKFKPKVPLKDFVGSPGFFAPEMVINGCYFGDKADVWSVGCIMLELIMGHDKFCDVWMIAYGYDVCKSKEQFTDLIHETVEQLPDVLNFSQQLHDFILRFVELRSSRRANIRALCVHEWLQGALNQELSQLQSAKNGSTSVPPLSPSNSQNGHSSSSGNVLLYESEMSGKHGGASHEVIKAAYSNISDRERKQMEEYIQHHQQDSKEEPHTMHLPPIVPQTPNLSHAKKILRRGEAIASADYTPHHHTQHTDSDVTTIGSFTPEHMSPSPNRSGSFRSPQNIPNRSPLPSVTEGSDEGISRLAVLTSTNVTATESASDGKPQSSSSRGTSSILKSKSELLKKENED